MLALIALGGCNRSAAPDTSPEASTPGVTSGVESTPTAGADAAPAEAVDDGDFRSTPIVPTRTAYLKTQAEGARVNLRSQPTTQAGARGYGLGGDQITLLRLAEGEGGFSWYYVKFAQSGAEGWVRGDFIDTTGQAANPTPETAPGTNPEISTGPCGESNRPAAFFETKSFTIHLCQTPKGLSYIGINKASNETLTTDDVHEDQGTYIAINGNYQYHINDKTLAVYQVTSGSYTQIESEDVVRHVRFSN
ncbi:SH3 domain-containing protein [Nodosilinea nodulosa]|uniref:SH3 domain-containing protein n=1 Tax=Nodosilinea nodulosa TaxID=416001 RepID=UPI0018C2C1F7|nr:SH3 domain-containing protein [Nodosilinea nodulosa]